MDIVCPSSPSLPPLVESLSVFAPFAPGVGDGGGGMSYNNAPGCRMSRGTSPFQFPQ